MSDGLADTVFNGIPDWVYEEEVLGVNFAHYINDPATRIAFAKFNDSKVEDFRWAGTGGRDYNWHQVPALRRPGGRDGLAVPGVPDSQVTKYL